MKRAGFTISYAILALAVVSCKEYDVAGMLGFNIPGVDERFEQSMEYNGKAGQNIVGTPSENYLVYVFSDTHLDGAADNLDNFVSAIPDNSAVPCTVFLGDQADCDNRGAFAEHVKGISSKSRLFVTAGNHELSFGGWQEYLSRWNTASFCFVVKTPSAQDLFIVTDSAGGSFGRKQRLWLGSILEHSSEYRHVTVLTHTHFFKKDLSQGLSGNYPMEETWELASLFSCCGVELVLTGHDHNGEDYGFKNVRYVTVPALKNGAPDAGYAVCSYGEDVSVEIKYL